MRHVLTSTSVVFALLLAREAQAHPVTIDPGAYPGEYVAAGAWHRVAKTFDLPTGTHNIGVGSSGFPISVSATGVVSTSFSGATVTGATVRFRTVEIGLDPSGVVGWHLVHNGPRRVRPRGDSRWCPG